MSGGASVDAANPAASPALGAAKPAAASAVGGGVGQRVRDQRLDFYRGMAMFIILYAHIPTNWWTLWIPARFGFSDATEIFVFCSGMASAMAFGKVFADRSFWLGSGRIVFRIGQVYWCHIGILLVSASIGYAIQSNGWGSPDVNYMARPYLVPLFDNTGATILGALTLTYIPGLFDILPMYLVILALIPVVMLAHRFAGRWGAGVLVVGLWLAATLAGLTRQVGDEGWDGLGAMLGAWAAETPLVYLNLPSRPWDTGTWFFNPFAWQLVFFAGFAFGMGWLPAPPRSRLLMWIAIAVLVASLPLAWHKIFPYLSGWWPRAWGGEALWAAREWIEPLRWKTWQGVLRFAHFLALAYLAWLVAGPAGSRLNTGFTHREWTGEAYRRLAIGATVVAVLTVPYAYVEEFAAHAPALDRLFFATVPLIDGRWMGIPQLMHLIALGALVWALIGPERRAKLLGPWFLAVVPVIRKVGTQSLAVFVVSIPLAITLGWLLDVMGRQMVTVALANLGGSAVLIGVAYTVAWFRRQPWRQPARPPATDTATASAAAAAAAARAGAETGQPRPGGEGTVSRPTTEKAGPIGATPA
ncbi:MAG: OpgC domain-containing protein [Pseudomonadota bacterium]